MALISWLTCLARQRYRLVRIVEAVDVIENVAALAEAALERQTNARPLPGTGSRPGCGVGG
jgi:hypothetical protein